jgi:hypothetical protein
MQNGADINIMDNEGRSAINYYNENYERIHEEHFIQGLDEQDIFDNFDLFNPDQNNNDIFLVVYNHLINNQINNNHQINNLDGDNEIIINQNPDLINIP